MVINSPLLRECKAAAEKDNRVTVSMIGERPHHLFLFDPRAKGCTPAMEVFHIMRLKYGVGGENEGTGIEEYLKGDGFLTEVSFLWGHVWTDEQDLPPVWINDPLAIDIPDAKALRLTCPKVPVAMAPGFCRVWVKSLPEFRNVLNTVMGKERTPIT